MSETKSRGARAVNLTIPRGLVEQIDRAAAMEKRSRSEFIREAVRIYMREKGYLGPKALARYRETLQGIEGRRDAGGRVEIEGVAVEPLVVGMPPGGSCGFPGLPREVRLVNRGRTLLAAYREVGGARYYLVGRARLEPSGRALSTGWFTIRTDSSPRGSKR